MLYEVIVSLQSLVSFVQYYQHSVPTNVHGVRGAYVKTAQKKMATPLGSWNVRDSNKVMHTRPNCH